MHHLLQITSNTHSYELSTPFSIFPHSTLSIMHPFRYNGRIWNLQLYSFKTMFLESPVSMCWDVEKTSTAKMQPALLARRVQPLLKSTQMMALKASPVVFQRNISYFVHFNCLFISYIEEQYARGRMVSPHLSIYKIHWATLSSGCHRVCGLGLWAGNSFLFS